MDIVTYDRNLQALINAYVGSDPVVKLSRGRPGWQHLYITLKLQPWMDVISFNQEENIFNLASSIEEAFPGLSELQMMVGKENDDFLELLIYVQRDDTLEVILRDGLATPVSREVDLDRLRPLLRSAFECMALEIGISRVSEAFLAERWVRRIGGHGYMRRHMWFFTPLNCYVSEIAENSGYIPDAVKLWKERQMDEDCKLKESCRCQACQDDVDHTDCSDTCPYKVARSAKRIKLVSDSE